MTLAQINARIAPILSLAVGMLARASGQVVALIVTLVAARYLNPTQFGVYAIAAAFVTMIRTFNYSATFQYIMQTPDLEDYSSECLAFGFLTSVVLSIFPAGLLILLPSIFGNEGIVMIYILMAPSNLISAFSAWSEAQVLRNGVTTKYYYITALTEIISGASSIVMLYLGYGVFSLVPMVYIRAMVLFASYYMLNKPLLSRGFNKERFLEVTRWTLPQYVSSLTGLFSNYGADFMIGAILSPAATGIYRAASRITGAVSDITAQPVRMIAMTVFARRKASGLHSADLWPTMAALSIFIALPALGGLAAIANLILPHVFGNAWANLGIVVSILSLGRIFMSMGAVATSFLVAHGRHKALLPVQLVSATCLLIGLLAFAKLGIEVTALVTAISTLVGVGIYSAMAYSTSQTLSWPSARLMLFAMLPGFAATAVAAVIAQSTLSPNAIWLTAIAVGSALVVWLVIIFACQRGLKPLLHPLRESSAPAS